MPKRTRGNSLSVAKGKDGEQLVLSAEDRSQHLYIAGTTNSGKSKLMEHLLRQDIVNWRHSKCGLLLLDWHGPIFDGVMDWLAANKGALAGGRPIVPIDLRKDDVIVAYNLLRRRQKIDASVLTDILVDQVAHVWGSADTDATPRFARIAATVFQALYEGGLTINQALRLLSFGVEAKTFRSALAEKVTNPVTRNDIEKLNRQKTEADLDKLTESSINRFQRLLSNKTLSAMLSQPKVSFDFYNALERGELVLVRLAGEGATSEGNAKTFASLMLGDLWAAARERGKGDHAKPFYVYLDEFQNFVSPTIASSLDEARGFGIHFTVAHQYPSQLIEESQQFGRRLYDSIMNNTKSKITFSVTQRERNLTPLADWFFLDTIDLKQVKHEQVTRSVVDYREETRTIEATSRGSSSSRGMGSGTSSGAISGNMASQSGIFDSSGVHLATSTWNEGQSTGQSSGESAFESASEGESESTMTSVVPMLIPLFGNQISSTQFFSYQEQLFSGEQQIRRLKNRNALARFVGMDAPVAFYTPEVRKMLSLPTAVNAYRKEALGKLKYALPKKKAAELITEHACSIDAMILENDGAEPTSTGRKTGKDGAKVNTHDDDKEST